MGSEKREKRRGKKMIRRLKSLTPWFCEREGKKLGRLGIAREKRARRKREEKGICPASCLSIKTLTCLPERKKKRRKDTRIQFRPSAGKEGKG